MGDADLAPLASLPHPLRLHSLDLELSKVTDAGLEHLHGLRGLRPR